MECEVYARHKPLWDNFLSLKQAQKLPHALLLCGLSGNGKNAFAQHMVHSLLGSKSHPNHVKVEPLEKTKIIKIEQIRALHTLVYQTASSHKIIQIYPAERMNQAASNALLKMLEEPSRDTLFILISDNPQLLPATITSRCQQWYFAPPHDSEPGLAGLFLTEEKVALVKQSSVFKERKQIVQDMLDCAQDKSNPSTIVEQWLNYPLDEFLDFIYVLNSEAIKLCNNIPSRVVEELPVLKKYAECCGGVFLYQQLDRVKAMKKTLGNNINAQLALEELMTMSAL